MKEKRLGNRHPVISFAYGEWERLKEAFAGKSGSEHTGEVWIGTWEELLSCKPELAGKIHPEDSRYSDDYVMIEWEGSLMLAGKSERAALYAVYRYAQEEWGAHWIYPGEATVIVPDLNRCNKRGEVYSPRMERRGFVFETVNDAAYMKLMIDWLVKNGINELFFTFSLWDQIGGEIASSIVERGISITLGGHSLKFFLDNEREIPYSEAEHPYTSKRQVDFQSSDWQRLLITKVISYCKHVPNLHRLSLWPEDVATGDAEGFLGAYVQFTEMLRDELLAADVNVEVEHIVYNAGLSWSMLERAGSDTSHSVNTLLAYWGRDYSYGYEDSPHKSDARARRALLDWDEALHRSGRKLTIFEYYSDHFMLSSLFPFIPRRIAEDMSYYESLRVHGIVNLVVPNLDKVADYPWKWAHQFNSYVFCRALWDDDIERIMDDYYQYYAPEERRAIRSLYEELERLLPQLSMWNIPLFPARAVDPEKAIAATEEWRERIVELLQDISGSVREQLRQPEIKEGSMPYRFGQHIVERADDLCRRWMKPGNEQPLG
ncbi:hypothetical protein [Paenibacillus chungangensis]|uniref:Uncharacterized protein n=1 Tax=Paenibacillus chungangensis TaxID=696535 RepID=A0ABW3HNZ2_9BACL